MSNKHKNPTISFRINEYERQEIEARILASGMLKKDYFVRSCIYNRICVVGKKKTIYPLVEKLQEIYIGLSDIYNGLTDEIVNTNTTSNLSNIETDKTEAYFHNTDITDSNLSQNDNFLSIRHQYISMLKAIIDLLDGAKYLWEGERHE